jgi:FlaA1/EpsC-like NDP-sugar epimerase
MLQQQVYILNTILMLIDALCIIAAGYSAFHIKFHLYDGMWHFSLGVFNLSVFMVMMANNYVMGKMGLYGDRRPGSYPGLFWRILKAVLIDFAILSAVIFIMGQKTYSRFFLLAFMGLSFGYICLARAGFRMYLNHTREKGFNLRNILVVGDAFRGGMVMDLLNQQLSMGHRVVGRLSISAEEDEGGKQL